MVPSVEIADQLDISRWRGHFFPTCNGSHVTRGSTIGTLPTVDEVMVVGNHYNLIELDRGLLTASIGDLVLTLRLWLLVEASCLGVQMGIAQRFAAKT